MSHKLTPSQQGALRWLVEKTEAGELEQDEVLYSYSNDGGVAVQSTRDNLELPSNITKSTLQILDREGLLHLRITSKGSHIATLTGRAFEAVENDFQESGNIADAGQVVFNLNGDFKGENARINIQSEDKSINVVEKTADELFAELRSIIESEISGSSERNQLLGAVDSMEKAESKSGFMKAYSAFVSAASDHITLFQPFLPALSQLPQMF